MTSAVPEQWPDVDVVMPVRDEAAHIEGAIASVRDQRYPGTVRVYVGLAPSRDGTERILERLAVDDPELHVVANPSGATAAGLNAAIRAGSAPVVVRLDGHARMSPTYLRDAVEVLRDSGAVNVGGRQLAQGTTPFGQAVAEAMTSRFGTGGARFHVGGPAGDVDTVYLGVFDRAALEAVGLFDERLVRNQDYELNIRLRRAGGRIRFDPRLWVTYAPRPDLRSLARQYFEYGYWKSVVARMYPGSLRVRQMAPTTVTVAIVACTAGAVLRPRLLVVPAGYVALVAAAAARSRHRWRLLGIYPAMHVGWGAGFVVGLLRARAAG